MHVTRMNHYIWLNTTLPEEIHARLEGLIQEDADELCPLLVQELDMIQQRPHLENINDV